MPFINCKIELNLKWTKHCVLSVLGNNNDNSDNNSDNIIFNIKDTKLYVLVILLAKDNRKLLTNF